MSYKNPRIIDDKSGLIVSQAIEKASGTLAQGIAVFGAEEKRREEVLEKENKRRDAVFIGLANEMAEDSALFNAGLEKGSSELRSVLIPRNEGLLKEINSIDIQQQINGNKDPRLSKRRSDLVSQISNGNTFAKSYIETASNLTEIMKDPQAFQIGQKTYVERSGSKDESEAILLATGGDPNFVTSFGDDLSITVTNKKSGEFFKNSREEFESKSKNLYITKNHNTAVQETELMRGGIYNEDGSVNYLLLKDMGSATPDSNEDTPGYITNYNVQTLNKNAVNNIKEESIDKTLAAIESYTSKQKQALYLKDIGITGNKLEDYQNGDNGKRRELIKESSDLIFKKNSGITLDDNNNYVIKTQIGNPTKITRDKLSTAEDDRIKTLKTINKGWNTITADTKFSELSNEERGKFIVQSLPTLRGTLSNTGAYGLTSDAVGNLVMPSGEVDDVFMAALSVEQVAERKMFNTPDKMKPGKTIDITSGTTVQNIATLTELLRLNYSLDYVQAEKQARTFLKK